VSAPPRRMLRSNKAEGSRVCTGGATVPAAPSV